MEREKLMEEDTPDTHIIPPREESRSQLTILGEPKLDDRIVRVKAGNREVGIPWPKDSEQQLEQMRETLWRVERTNEVDGGPMREDLTRLGWVINALIQEEGGDKKLAQRLLDEYEARTTFHAVYLKYILAGDASSVKSIVDPMKKEYLNTLLRDTPEVWAAFLGYEKNAKDFLRAREAIPAGEGSKRAIRERIAREVSFDQTRSEDNWQKFLWAQNIAERFWSVTGRRAAHDELKQKDPSVSLEEAKAKGDVTWLDADATGGELAIRKMNCVDDWILTQKKDLRLHTELAKNIDLGSKDFFGGLPGAVESFYRNQLMDEYVKLGVANPKQAAELEAERKVSEMFNGLQKVPKKGKKSIADGGVWDDQEWPRGKDLAAALQKIDWRGIDFGMMADTPLSDWGYTNLEQPDKARDALVEYLRNPSDDSLGKLTGVFGYQKGGQYETKRKLLSNYVDFRMSDKSKELDMLKLNQAEGESLIARVGKALGLNHEDVEKVIKETLGDELGNKVIRMSQYFEVGKGFMAFLLELIFGILKSGFSLK